MNWHQQQTKYFNWQIKEPKMEPIKMTREEAHKKAFEAAKGLEGKEVDQVIKVLEALGLLKFEEPKKPSPVSIIISCIPDLMYGLTTNITNIRAKGIIDMLEKHGYKIVDVHEFGEKK